MAVDYREVNTQLDATANQLPFQKTLFQLWYFPLSLWVRDFREG
jgi:hypothetical protein